MGEKKQKPRKLKEQEFLLMVGWREWATLPALSITRIKAKVDTGARTSALHAFALRPFRENGKDMIAFDIHPYQHDFNTVVSCTAEVADRRWVSDSGGHREERYVIHTPIEMAGIVWSIDITLTERDTMLFRMLLGRSAMYNRFVVNPAKSFVLTK